MEDQQEEVQKTSASNYLLTSRRRPRATAGAALRPISTTSARPAMYLPQTTAVAGIEMVRVGTCHAWCDYNGRDHDHGRTIAIRNTVEHTAAIRTTVTAEPTKASDLYYLLRNRLGRR